MVFAICVAGKNANTTALALNPIFDWAERKGDMPIFYIERAISVHGNGFLRDKGIGCYNNRAKTTIQLAAKIAANKDFLRIATVTDLEQIHGIGPKTARFFVMHSRPNQRVAALDTHILKELKAHGVIVPKSTPSAGPRYRHLERKFIQLADDSGMSVADYDLEVWKKHRKKAFWPVDN